MNKDFELSVNPALWLKSREVRRLCKRKGREDRRFWVRVEKSGAGTRLKYIEELFPK
jgi:hypothetical protein